ncbi:MAG: glycosyltransferase family 39 protein [Nitrospirae bacterium]|nr:glycosyltransferase family 39 protein [Nitrospirota bacterium]
MGNILEWFKKNDYVLIFSLLTFLTYIALFVSRTLDDTYILSKASFIERHPVIFLFFFSYIATTLFWREPEVIVDTSRYFTQAKHLEVYGTGYYFREWGRSITAWTDMPLVPFLYGLIFKLFGEARIFIQAFTTFLYSMTVILTYLIGKTLWNEDIGLLGGMLFLGIPYLFIQTPLMLVDIPTMFFLTLSVFTFSMALKRGGSWMPLASFAIFLAFFSKYSTWLMLSVLVVIFLVYLLSQSCQLSAVSCQPQKPRNYFYRGSIIFFIATLLIGVVFWCKFDVFSEQIRLLLSYQKHGLARWKESFISTFFFQIHPFITAAAVYSIYAALRKRDLKYMIIAWLVILVIVLQIKRIRYIVMVFPMLSLMASYGLVQIKNREAVNLRDAGSFIDSINEENIQVFTLSPADPVSNPSVSVPILDLFTNKKITYDYSNVSNPLREKIEESALRFTWEYKNPEYYMNNKKSKEDSAVVVISDDANDPLSDDIKRQIAGYRLSKVFDKFEGIFLYRTIVRVYQLEKAGQMQNSSYRQKGGF